MNIPSLFKKRYVPLNKIEVIKAHLLSNYQYLSSLSDQKVAPVLKSNAYGHGLVLTAKILDTVGAPFFCVDSLYEAYELLKAKIKTQILIMGYVNPYNLRVKQLPFSYVAYDMEFINAINTSQPGASVHIFIDTGMHREGITVHELPNFLTQAKKFEHVRIDGLMSHLGAADQGENTATKQQITNFENAQELVLSAGLRPQWVHISASGGMLYLQKHTDALGNVVRTGSALYGFDPKGKNKHVKPTLHLETTIAQIKNLRKGERVGYDFTFTAKDTIVIGILPIGYFDGLDRRLSNKGYISIKGQYCRIIGRISMNITTVDLTHISHPYIGQEVIIYSDKVRDKNSIEESARICKTSPLDLLVHLSPTTKRVVI